MDAPQEPSTQVSPLTAKVQAALDSIRPALQMDGGDCDLVEVTADGTVSIHMRGACDGCPSSTMTLTMGIEKRLRASVPEVQRVVAV